MSTLTKIGRLVLTTLLSIAFVFVSSTIAVAGGQKEVKHNFTVGFTVGMVGHPYHQRVWKAALQRAHELGINLVILDDKTQDISIEASNVDTLLAMKVDGVMMMPPSLEGSVASCQRVVDAGLPLVCLVDEAKGFRYVGSTHVQGAGAGLVAETLVKALNSKGTIVYIKGSAGNDTERLRNIGFREVVDKYPDLKIIFEQNGKWDRPTGMQIMEDAMAKYPAKGQISAVFAHNDEMALGAIEAMRQAGRMDEGIQVFGIDGTADMLDAIKKGEVTMTAFQNAELQGTRAVEAMYALLHGRKVPDSVPVAWEAITKDNVNDWINKFDPSTSMFKVAEKDKMTF
jgi:ABC-type sugar transport system substrate-binding protein